MPVRVQREDFDISTELAHLRASHPETGAVVAFVGTVREMNGTGVVSTMELEHYPGMTEAAVEDIVAEARRRWPLIDVLGASYWPAAGKLTDRPDRSGGAPSWRSFCGLRVRHGSPQDARTVLEEGADRTGHVLGRRTRRR